MSRIDHGIDVRPLPAEAEAILARMEIPARLRAHLMLVHDTAAQIVGFLKSTWPDLAFNERAVLIGAAWHDIGKAARREELHGPGHLHEEAGYEMLIAAGIEPDLARFAKSHGMSPSTESSLEDLIVALADTCWKGKRDHALEEAVAGRIADRHGQSLWDILIPLDSEIERIAALGDARLEWQSRYSVLL